MGGWLLKGHNSRHGRWYFRERACREPARPASSPQARMEASTADRTRRRLPPQASPTPPRRPSSYGKRAGSPSARGSGALRPIVRCRFEPPVPIGKKAVHRFAALIIASAVAITPTQAQTASELRISGTVEKFDGNLVAL